MTQQSNQHRPLGLAKAAVVSFAAFAISASFAGAARADDACHKVATAKYMQWRQPRIAREMTVSYADGKVKKQDAIFTENTLYVLDGPAWHVGPLSTQQHRVHSPEQVSADMGLSDCAAVDNAVINGEHASAYTYKSGSQDVDASGKIWVSDTTGLPLRDEMSPDAATPKWPVKMAADYSYGSDVRVPKGAELADFYRRNDGREILRDLLTSSPDQFR